MVGIHVVIVRLFRRVTSKAFYRMRPAAANLIVLVRECGLVALTQWFVVVRCMKLFLTMILYIGRVDTPFLYDQCGQIGGLRVDREPYMFQIDILQHEAHRHPFIETLGTMYLYKLRYNDSFCTVAGSTWRLVFLFVLMPWLSKYRAMRRPQVVEELDIEEGSTDSRLPPPRPLRAVTLVDPQAYALRAVSLVPVASAGGAAFGSSISLFGHRKHDSLSLIDDSEEDEKDEEIQRLEHEVLRLKMQLRLHDLNPPPEVAFNTPKQKVNFNGTRPKPGWEDDYEPPEPLESCIKSPQPHGVSRDDMVARHFEEGPNLAARVYKEGSLPSALKRNNSKGLPEIRPPTPRATQEVSWMDDKE